MQTEDGTEAAALAGLRVLELAEGVAGEYCGKLLADFGATVIKLEKPGCGSPTRDLGPFAPGAAAPEGSGLFAYLNTNKRSVALDVTSTSGLAALGDMLKRVDVVVDDHPAGWLETAGLAPASISATHPSLVLCSITAFGQSPPEDRRHAEDLTVIHSSGWGYHTPSAAAAELPPLKGPGRFLPSYEAALDAAMCIVAAVCEREQSGLGRFIDISQQAVLASRVDYVLGQMVAGELPVGAERTAFDLGGPAGMFPCREGYAYIWMSTPTHWAALRQLLGDPPWMASFPERWLERECTPERVAQCRRHIAQWLATQDKHEAAAAAQELGLTLVAVNNARDLLASSQYRFRHFFARLEHPVIGSALYPTVPYKLSATPATLHSPAPLLGQHTRAEPGAARGSGIAKGGRPVTARMRGGPLAGLRVVELTKVWAGPYAGKLLAFLGAEVIRVESEASLDVTRTFGVADIDNAPGFQSVNPQKLSVQIDMKSKEGVRLILDLAARSDVLIENLRPGAVRRLGLGYEQVRAVRPDIVYASMGMWGNEGPLSYQTGYAPCFAALGGLSALVGYEGEPPAGMNVRYGDSTVGTLAAFATVVALRHRQRTGVGQYIDVSAVESMSSMIGDTLMDYALNGTLHECDGNRHPDMAPHATYACRDGDWIAIAVNSDPRWRALAEAMGQAGLAGDPRFATHAARKANEAELDRLVSAWTAGRDAAELVRELQRRGVAAAKSQNSLDLVSDAQLWSRGFFRDVADPAGQSRPIVGPAWRMSREAAIAEAAPRLGQHNAYVLGEILGLSAERQRELAAAGVTR